MKTDFTLDEIDWKKGDGLVPAIVQDGTSLRVLMLGYVNRAAMEATLSSGFVTFFSRSKQRLWQKGETSGNVLRVTDVKLDCDKDTLLFTVNPVGPTCHTGAQTCFGAARGVDLSVLADLAATIKQRHENPSEKSYTASLFKDGLARIAQKVGEEGVETALAGALKADNLKEESADLLYHLLVLLEARGLALADVLAVLRGREK